MQVSEIDATSHSKQMAAEAIRSALFAPTFEQKDWSKIEQFATGKAREYRSAKLKRLSSSTAVHAEAVSQIPRRIVKVPRRAVIGAASTATDAATKWPNRQFVVSKQEFEEYKSFQESKGGALPQWFMQDNQKALEIIQKYSELEKEYR